MVTARDVEARISKGRPVPPEKRSPGHQAAIERARQEERQQRAGERMVESGSFAQFTREEAERRQLGIPPPPEVLEISLPQPTVQPTAAQRQALSMGIGPVRADIAEQLVRQRQEQQERQQFQSAYRAAGIATAQSPVEREVPSGRQELVMLQPEITPERRQQMQMTRTDVPSVSVGLFDASKSIRSREYFQQGLTAVGRPPLGLSESLKAVWRGPSAVKELVSSRELKSSRLSMGAIRAEVMGDRFAAASKSFQAGIASTGESFITNPVPNIALLAVGGASKTAAKTIGYTFLGVSGARLYFGESAPRIAGEALPFVAIGSALQFFKPTGVTYSFREFQRSPIEVRPNRPYNVYLEPGKRGTATEFEIMQGAVRQIDRPAISVFVGEGKVRGEPIRSYTLSIGETAYTTANIEGRTFTFTERLGQAQMREISKSGKLISQSFYQERMPALKQEQTLGFGERKTSQFSLEPFKETFRIEKRGSGAVYSIGAERGEITKTIITGMVTVGTSSKAVTAATPKVVRIKGVNVGTEEVVYSEFRLIPPRFVKNVPEFQPDTMEIEQVGDIMFFGVSKESRAATMFRQKQSVTGKFVMEEVVDFRLPDINGLPGFGAGSFFGIRGRRAELRVPQSIERLSRPSLVETPSTVSVPDMGGVRIPGSLFHLTDIPSGRLSFATSISRDYIPGRLPDFGLAPASLFDMNIRTNIRSDLKKESDIKIDSDIMTELRRDFRHRTDIKTDLASELEQPTKIRTDLRSEIASELQRQTRLRTDSIIQTRVPTIIPPILTPPPPPPSIVQKFKLSFAGRKRTSGVDSFSVFVRRRGKFQLIGSNLGYNRAFALGRRVVAETPARTFRLVPKGGARAPPFSGRFDRMLRGPVGKSRLRAPLTFIEKARFGIDRPGEFAGITAKGLATVRAGRVNFNLRRLF